MTTSVLTNGQLTLRPASPADVEDCGLIFFDAFDALAKQHAFPTEPSSPQFTTWKVADMVENPGFYGAVAERAGRIVGSVFMDERADIVGIGPVTVDPANQDRGVGRELMLHVLARCEDRSVVGVRLVQTAYHYRSLALYASLGFRVREPLSVMQGALRAATPTGSSIRETTVADLDCCSSLCAEVHGHERRQELGEGIAAGTARLVERSGRITGYATGFGYGWHAVARTNEDLMALLSSASSFVGLGILVPSGNFQLLEWGLANGLRIVQQSTLMTRGLYSDPAGAYLPSVLF